MAQEPLKCQQSKPGHSSNYKQNSPIPEFILIYVGLINSRCLVISQVEKLRLAMHGVMGEKKKFQSPEDCWILRAY